MQEPCKEGASDSILTLSRAGVVVRRGLKRQEGHMGRRSAQPGACSRARSFGMSGDQGATLTRDEGSGNRAREWRAASGGGMRRPQRDVG
jgi:hypothetical protein